MSSGLMLFGLNWFKIDLNPISNKNKNLKSRRYTILYIEGMNISFFGIFVDSGNWLADQC